MNGLTIPPVRKSKILNCKISIDKNNRADLSESRTFL